MDTKEQVKEMWQEPSKGVQANNSTRPTNVGQIAPEPTSGAFKRDPWAPPAPKS